MILIVFLPGCAFYSVLVLSLVDLDNNLSLVLFFSLGKMGVLCLSSYGLYRVTLHDDTRFCIIQLSINNLKNSQHYLPGNPKKGEQLGSVLHGYQGGC